jgi:hypothetical protein
MPTSPRVIRLGTEDVAFPSPQLGQIEDSSPLLALNDGGVSLRARFERDGFVFLRGALGAESVLSARDTVVSHLAAQGNVFDPSQPPGVLLEACGLGCLPNLEGRNGITHAPTVQGVLEGAPMRRAVGALLGTTELRTFDYKWLRAMPRKVFTGAHCDAVYMSRGSPRLLTCWVPLEEGATLELGALALYRGSHRAPGGLGRLRGTYGAFDTEAEPGFVGSGWYSESPSEVSALDTEEEGRGDRGWVSGDFAAGDVIIFGMHTLHMSTANLTDRVRVSCDVRWQPASDPIDDRYTGSVEELKEKQKERKKGGAWASGAEGVTMEALRKKWEL